MDTKAQIERFKTGFPWLDITAPATPGNGIEILSEEKQEEAASYLQNAEIAGRCKFVPASGAASRMFKDIFAGSEIPNDATRKLADNLTDFAFYDEQKFGKAPFDPCATAKKLLLNEEGGLGYGSKPKGVLKFHRYPSEVRTAIAEHFIEGQDYMRNPDGTVNIVVTISPEHQQLFEQAVAEIREQYEKRYGVRYEVTFTFQDKETDTIAVTPSNEPFLKDDGKVLRRPAGHGALIHNLNALDAELVSIKNIDNVCVESMQKESGKWKKILMGRALQLRDRIFGYIYELDQFSPLSTVVPMYIPGYNPTPEDRYASEECQSLCNEIEEFLSSELCVTIPPQRSCKERAEALRAKLNRPIRVCGMVRNEGEPGGGPFIVRGKDGSTSLQILESVQINPDDPAAAAALKAATHFNPVDLVCLLRDSNGEKFNLTDYVDEETGFISSKSYQGRELKALELPGLWNGSMSDWNTLFVEVPASTFNPVKTVLDLLRPSHRN